MSNLIDSILLHAWSRYRAWAMTAREDKRRLTRARIWVLGLSVAAAAFGMIAQHLSSWEMLIPGKIVSGLSVVCLLCTPYLALKLLGPERVRSWTRARSLAESLKREFFLARAGVGDYRLPDAAPALRERVQDLEHVCQDLPTLPEQPQSGNVELEPLTVDQYIETRIVTQANDYYRPQAAKHQRYINRYQRVETAATVVAIAVGVYGGLTGGTFTGWIAVISTLSMAIAAHVYSERHQYLVVRYQNTAEKLDSLVADWRASGKTDNDHDDRDGFIRQCEEVLSGENDDWMIVRGSG